MFTQKTIDSNKYCYRRDELKAPVDENIQY